MFRTMKKQPPYFVLHIGLMFSLFQRTCPKNPTQDENIEIKSEIQVEDAMLQEHGYRVSNDGRGKSSTPNLTSVGQPVVCKVRIFLLYLNHLISF